MKKLILIAFAFAFAALARADRTANRAWVQRNFAPTGLVARVEALEAGGGGSQSETDPVFGAWKGGASVAVGQGAEAEGETSVAIGKGAVAEDEEGIAVGKGAVAEAAYAVQLGSGRNTGEGTLKFLGWTLLDNEGCVPSARLANVVPRSWHSGIPDSELCLDMDAIWLCGADADYGDTPFLYIDCYNFRNLSFEAGEETLSGGEDRAFSINYGERTVTFDGGETTLVFPVPSGSTATIATLEDIRGRSLAFGEGAECASLGAAAVGYGAKADGQFCIQLGNGTNDVQKTLKFLDWTLVGADGKIPLARLPGSVLTQEGDPQFYGWLFSTCVAIGSETETVGEYSVAIGKGAYAAEDAVSVGPGTYANSEDTVVIGKDAYVQEVGSVAIGKNAKTTTKAYGVAIGEDAKTTGLKAVAIGYGAQATAACAAQIGPGTNSASGSLKFCSWTLVDESGYIPAARLAPANVLAAIKGMSASQLAELKTFLGIGQ